ncbi:MAG: PD-(D/E)XK nuclease family protein [Chloroflexota bacterium]|nr:PD-(D/E)XK nuclease family protein [Chloroflexota bacterium]
MTLPHDFQFNQGNLQDFVDCQRRFQLRHLERLAWPAMEAEPARDNERRLQQGALFHRLVHQYFLGISADRLSRMDLDDEVAAWWGNFLAHGPALSGVQHPEITLSAPLADAAGGIGYVEAAERHLIAKYDLVVRAEDGRFSIFDWKTSHRPPSRSWLQQRLQSRVYPYLLVRAGAALNEGQPIAPDQIEMVYWFAKRPDHPERFRYSQQKFNEDQAYIHRLVEQIATASLNDQPFPLVVGDKACRFCIYRSHCDRGQVAADLADFDMDDPDGPSDSLDLSFDFENIAEIDY